MIFKDFLRRLQSVQGAVRVLLIICTSLFVTQLFLSGALMNALGFTPTAVSDHHQFWRLITFPFLQPGILAWLFNMLVLWMLGTLLEAQWGTPYFVRFFILTTLGAAAAVLLIAPHLAMAMIGLSPFVFAMLVAFTLLYPDSTMYLYFVLPVKAWHALAVFAAFDLYAVYRGGSSAITSIANLGSMVFAFLYIRFGTAADLRLGRLFSGALRLPKPEIARPRVSLHEVTDDLVLEVDRILDKVSRKGAESLTIKEKEIMNRYTRTRR